MNHPRTVNFADTYTREDILECVKTRLAELSPGQLMSGVDAVQGLCWLLGLDTSEQAIKTNPDSDTAQLYNLCMKKIDDTLSNGISGIDDLLKKLVH